VRTPGPFSARWLGPDASDEDRLFGLIAEVARRSPDDRRVRYVCVVALSRPLADPVTARGECIVSSEDHGRTWAEYAGNPVVKHTGRDPRLLWHAGRKTWIMAVYDEHAGKRWIAFYSSPDLKKWQFESRIEDFFECPDLFELPIEGERAKTKWVLSAADGKYLLGDFNGRSFRKESGKHQLWYGNFYAAQTFSDTPDGRRIQRLLRERRAVEWNHDGA